MRIVPVYDGASIFAMGNSLNWMLNKSNVKLNNLSNRILVRFVFKNFAIVTSNWKLQFLKYQTISIILKKRINKKRRLLRIKEIVSNRNASAERNEEVIKLSFPNCNVACVNVRCNSKGTRNVHTLCYWYKQTWTHTIAHTSFENESIACHSCTTFKKYEIDL